jgi:CHASE1-domain containing sensor protein
MGMTNLHLSLEKKYAALVGDLENVRANIARIEREQMKLPDMQSRILELEALVESAANLLKSITPDWTPDHIEPAKPWTHTLPIPFGSCGRRALAILRESQTGMTTRQLAVEVLRGVGVEEPDRLVIRKTTVAVEASLRSHRGKTVESSGKYPAQWRSIINPDIVFDP